jgi:formate-dependent nitrite reductase membrane component NrfD
MNVFVADPEWGWWIILYFYLGGIAAGSYFMATLIDLMGSDEDRELPRIGYLIAFPLIALCGIFLTVDLHRPERFWHMLLRSETVHAALEEGWPWSGSSWALMVQAPLVKYWSPMSIGSWAISLFGLCSFLSFLGSLWPEGRMVRGLRRSWFGRGLQVVGCLVGFFVGAYTGSLLTATNQPVWSDSTWVAPLFLTSAASTGIAMMFLLAPRRQVPRGSLDKLERSDLWALGLELVVFVAFLASLGPLLLPVLQSWHGRLLVWGTLPIGLLIPLALRLRIGVESRRAEIAAAVLALVGGFILRFAILGTPPELLRESATARGVFGPEAKRPRGEGTGADMGNRPPGFQPRSKVFTEE